MSIELIKKHDLNVIRNQLLSVGYFILPSAYERSFCTTAINFIDNYQSPDLELNYLGTETRIWDSQKLDTIFHQFYHDCNKLLSYIYNDKFMSTTLLAIKNMPLHSEDIDSRLNRWHIDSFNRQLKIFLFLTDTTEESGPFEFIPKTHKTLFKTQMLLKGNYFDFLDFIRKEKRKYQALNEKVIQNLIKKNFSIKTVLCSAGTLLIVDTSAIHRARPCIKLPRYALTTYY